MLKKILFFTFVPSLLLAASYTINTNAAQETRLTRLRTLLNAKGESFADNQALVTEICSKGFIERYDAEEAQDIVSWLSVINSLTQAQRETLCSAAGKSLINGRCQ